MSRQPRIRRTAVAAVAVAVILIAAVVVLVNRSSGGGGPAAANAATGNERTALLWHNLIECVRKHGHPEFRDPVIKSNGDPDFGAQGVLVKRAMPSVSVVCRAELAALPAAGRDRTPTAAELHAMVLFSRCMREHGLSDWPDPHADGTFPLNQRLMGLGKSGTRAQMRACLPLMGANSKGIAISPTSVPPGSKKAIAAGNAQ